MGNDKDKVRKERAGRKMRAGDHEPRGLQGLAHRREWWAPARRPPLSCTVPAAPHW